jgi:putative copper resistance protein D
VTVSLAVRFLHVAAALTWVGGMLFVALVLVPVTRRLEDPALRRRLMHEAGLRFRAVGWAAMALLVATGLINIWLRPELLTLARFWLKVVLVILAIALSALHDFVLGPRAGRPDAAPSLRPAASWIARVNLMLVLVVVYLGLSFR